MECTWEKNASQNQWVCAYENVVFLYVLHIWWYFFIFSSFGYIYDKEWEKQEEHDEKKWEILYYLFFRLERVLQAIIKILPNNTELFQSNAKQAS